MKDIKRMNFALPLSSFYEMKQIANSLKMTHSNFIRKSILLHIEKTKKEKLAIELVEGYKANANLDKKTCADFKFIDGENI